MAGSQRPAAASASESSQTISARVAGSGASSSASCNRSIAPRVARQLLGHRQLVDQLGPGRGRCRLVERPPQVDRGVARGTAVLGMPGGRTQALDDRRRGAGARSAAGARRWRRRRCPGHRRWRRRGRGAARPGRGRPSGPSPTCPGGSPPARSGGRTRAGGRARGSRCGPAPRPPPARRPRTGRARPGGARGGRSGRAGHRRRGRRPHGPAAGPRPAAWPAGASSTGRRWPARTGPTCSAVSATGRTPSDARAAAISRTRNGLPGRRRVAGGHEPLGRVLAEGPVDQIGDGHRAQRCRTEHLGRLRRPAG